MNAPLKRSPTLRIHHDHDLLVDNFAGGGGATTGIEQALGRSPDIAINHDPEAIAMHQANHPDTHHFCGSVFDVNPAALCRGRSVALAWFSPDCTFHSKARGGKPFRDRNVARRRRGLAGVVVKWANAVRPRVIICENVEEFEDWGPLNENGKPDPERRGESYRRWLSALRNAGYVVESRQLRACDYGAPTSRKRLFIIARCDGRPIAWPAPTHGPGCAQPYRTAAECIDWSVPCRSIFGRKKDLAENTLRRIARGVQRFVVDAAEPFIVPVSHGGVGRTDVRVHSIREPLRTITSHGRGSHALVSPTLIQTSYGERKGQSPRILDLHKPLGTVVAGGVKHALVSAFLAKHYGGHEGPGASLQRPMSTVTTVDHHSLVAAHMLKLHGSCADGQSLDKPAPTIRAQGTHLAEVRAFLARYNGVAAGQPLQLPLGAITTARRFGLVYVAGTPYEIVDIAMRMLWPRELFRAQGFPDSYIIDPIYQGKPLTKTAQVQMCGNSVSPYVARALVAANVDRAEVVAA